MGLLPLQFLPGEHVAALGLTGHEVFDILGADDALVPRGTLTVSAALPGGAVKTFGVRVRIDTPEELTAYRNGGILPYVLRQLLKKK
jgi:aconitate hydratase